MTTPQWTLILFALWTLLTLILSVGVMRWYLLLSGKAQPQAFRSDVPHGTPRYRRAMRAHANCVENLPVYGAIIFGLTLLKITSSLLNTVAVIFIVSRICQTIIHIVFTDTNVMALLRFMFFFVQVMIMFLMISQIVTHS